MLYKISTIMIFDSHDQNEVHGWIKIYTKRQIPKSNGKLWLLCLTYAMRCNPKVYNHHLHQTQVHHHWNHKICNPHHLTHLSILINSLSLIRSMLLTRTWTCCPRSDLTLDLILNISSALATLVALSHLKQSSWDAIFFSTFIGFFFFFYSPS